MGMDVRVEGVSGLGTAAHIHVRFSRSYSESDRRTSQTHPASSTLSLPMMPMKRFPDSDQDQMDVKAHWSSSGVTRLSKPGFRRGFGNASRNSQDELCGLARPVMTCQKGLFRASRTSSVNPLDQWDSPRGVQVVFRNAASTYGAASHASSGSMSD